MTCTICPHEKRNEIDNAIVLGHSIRQIAQRFAASSDALYRHRACIAGKLSKADARIGGRIALRVEGLIAQLERMATEAHDARAAKAFLEVARELRPTYELGAKLSGEMQAASVAAFLTGLGVRDESEVRSALELVRTSGNPSMEQCEEESVALLLMVLRERPERRDAVLARLGSCAVELSPTEGSMRNGHDTNGNGAIGSGA